MSGRVLLVVLLAVVLVLAAGCGGDRDEPREATPRRDPFAAVSQDRARDASPLRAAPRWEGLATLRGSGSDRRALSVAAGAIQWRARWACRRGDVRVVTRAPGGRPARLLASRCPGSGVATAVSTGKLTLGVSSRGLWRLQIEQQVDTPLREPPLAAMRDGSARRLGTGRFFSLERRSRGSAAVYRMPDGRLALRFEGFRTAASADLFVWVTRSRRPTSSRAALDSRHVELAPLKATAGSQNYLLPRRLTAADVRSIVIWCEPIRIAYAAASLG